MVALSILIAALVSFLIGGLWYSPVMFGQRWGIETGFDEQTPKQHSSLKPFAIAFVANLIIATILKFFMGDVSSLTGAFYGAIVGFAWVSMAMAVNDAFERRSFVLWAINAGYHTVTLCVMGAILGAV